MNVFIERVVSKRESMILVLYEVLSIDISRPKPTILVRESNSDMVNYSVNINFVFELVESDLAFVEEEGCKGSSGDHI